MKSDFGRLVLKLILLATAVFGVIGWVDFFVDPANLFHQSSVEEMSKLMSEGYAVECPANYDEDLLLEKMMAAIGYDPELLVLGSSRVMYGPWERLDESVYCGGMSGSYLGDYYGVIGAYEYYHGRLPSRVIIGLDPWAFYTNALQGRHTGLQRYAEYEKHLVDQGHSDVVMEEGRDTNFKKVMELFKPAYFQASMNRLFSDTKSKGIKKAFFQDQDAVSAVAFIGDSGGKSVSEMSETAIFEVFTPGERQKRLPWGRLIMSAANLSSTVNEIDGSVEENIISSGQVYQLGDGFYEINQGNFDEFKALIERLQYHGTEVEIYLPPWYPLVYDYILESGNFPAVMELEQQVRDYASDRLIAVHGSYDPAECNISKEDFADWLHLRADKVLESYE